MAKGLKRRNSTANGFTDAELAEILRKESAMDAWNRRDNGAIPADLVMFLGIMDNFAPGEVRRIDWRRFLELSQAIDDSYRSAPPPWPGIFPKTTADIEKIVNFRAANPA